MVIWRMRTWRTSIDPRRRLAPLDEDRCRTMPHIPIQMALFVTSHHATPSPSAHPGHSPGVGDEHICTYCRPPAPHRTSSVRSSLNRFRSSIRPAIEEIPDFFRPLTTPIEGENPLIHLIAEHGLLHHSSVAAGKKSLVFKSGYLKEGWKWKYVPQSKRDIFWLRWKVFFTWDLQMSFVIYEVWCRKAAIRLGSQGYHHSISSREASSSRGPAYRPHELEELRRDHQRLQETLLNERMERQEQMQRDKMERQEENRDM
ncbi:hypothetical protein Syun_008604 [Stephania yunnanensis]|uniref:Uncharacterized protein n=1 Tax=Stephania yunnanensis TaxID=152371 RepID=A0AAP0PQ60_9MAGN